MTEVDPGPDYPVMPEPEWAKPKDKTAPSPVCNIFVHYTFLSYAIDNEFCKEESQNVTDTMYHCS